VRSHKHGRPNFGGGSADANSTQTYDQTMKMIHHVVDIGVPRASVMQALTTTTGLFRWRSTAVSGSSERVGGTVHFIFAGDFNPDMQITELEEPAKLVWRCVGGHPPWADNTFEFVLVEHDGGTRLRFWQHYASELDDDSYGSYNFNWANYLESLRLLCVEGAGKPFPAPVEASR
jgi:uncharacterized protein YndB with AHSA1/START domain